MALLTFKQFFDKYNGKKCDFDNAYQGQCVDLFRAYCAEVLGVPQAYPVPQYPDRGRGAADFWTGYETTPQLKDNFDKILNTPEFIPQDGDVVIWNRKAGGGHGHIAICILPTGNLDHFFSFDQNWKTISVCEVIDHTYTNVYGVLRAKKQAQQSQQGGDNSMDIAILKKYDVQTIEELDKRIEEHVGTTWGSEENPGGGYLGSARREITQLKTDLEIKTRESENRQKDMEEVTRTLDLPVSTDKAAIITDITHLLTDQDAYEKLKEKFEGIEAEHQREIDIIRKEHQKELSNLQGEISALLQKVKELDEKQKELQGKYDSLAQKQEVVNWFTQIITRIFKK